MSAAHYEHVKRALHRHAAPLDAAECHGLLCGLLCAHGSVNLAMWLDECMDDETGPLAPEETAAFERLFTHTCQAINSEELEFQPCLPADEAPLMARTQALASWCQGYLYALGGVGRAAMPAQTRELIGDFSELAQAEVGAGDTPELEQSFFELVEFVRVGVLLINEELQPLHAKPGVH